MTNVEVEHDPDLNSLKKLIKKAAAPGVFDTKFKYQRAPVPS